MYECVGLCVKKISSSFENRNWKWCPQEIERTAVQLLNNLLYFLQIKYDIFKIFSITNIYVMLIMSAFSLIWWYTYSCMHTMRRAMPNTNWSVDLSCKLREVMHLWSRQIIKLKLRWKLALIFFFDAFIDLEPSCTISIPC